MRESPGHVAVPDLLATVQREWNAGVVGLTHIPIGFGAHHWEAPSEYGRRLFVTFDRLEPKRNAQMLESAYAAAAKIAESGLEFVLACIPAASGGFTVPLHGGAVSVTAWTDGSSGDGPPADKPEAEACARMLARLHSSPKPSSIPHWQPLNPVPSIEHLTRILDDPWHVGPYGEPARNALALRLVQIREWTGSYDLLAHAAQATRDTWVPTHGEPDTGNQLVASDARLLVDWESLKLAPRERDLRFLIESGFAWEGAYGIKTPDWQMVEMFDLEWRLSEIIEYAGWFSAAHTGTASDDVAFEGLLEELEREEWPRH